MSNKNKVKNTTQIVKGKVKEVAGKSTGDHHLEADGKADQMKGDIKQAGEKAKDAFKR